MAPSDPTLDHTDFDISHVVLSSFYFMMLICSLVALINTKAYTSLYTLLFHLLLMLGAACRAVLFILFPFAAEGVIHLSVNVIDLVATLPTFFFFTVYSITMIVGTLIQQEHLPRTVQIDIRKVVPYILFGNLAMYIIVAILFIVDFTVDAPAHISSRPTTVTGIIIQLFTSFIYFNGSLFFFIVLFKHYVKHWREFRAANRTSEFSTVRKMFALVFPFSSVSFMIRATLAAVTAFVVIRSWYKDLLYYTFLEVLPVSFLLLIMSQRTTIRLLRIAFLEPERQPIMAHLQPLV
ncbi:hypothetical protein SAMD00019534_107690 [Acytostelium subglobosum LB1]|uniref:hypothetical protein n=1 Tax=Acytostelium subglobosum LB1 TaxID=1410327 RepID=UPI0006448712|nr:hypothetical protein SAMD00019534_107690 [Acytostelium subglobosum LB1]GAM27593.1 hypothetical protein SAMD00019534_107690 [Acytostelium subglobosum LB1]|eukprot:XP_012749252.1 hypothetical protein SAMD00019534_107690 [Acytostelium subglobosum LB1]